MQASAYASCRVPNMVLPRCANGACLGACESAVQTRVCLACPLLIRPDMRAQKGCTRMLLTVNDDNKKARRFFERCFPSPT